MSTRYVWDVYTVNSEYQEKLSKTTSQIDVTGKVNAAYWCGCFTEYSFDKTLGIYSSVGTIDWREYSDSPADMGTFSYMIPKFTDSTASVISSTSAMLALPDTPGIYYWTKTLTSSSGGYGNFSIRLQNSSGTNVNFKYYSQESINVAGTFKNNFTSDSLSARPSNGVGTTTATKDNWYTYIGSDNIDPISISYSTDKPERNKSITIYVTPSTQNKYGGTISYLYQYSINGGTSWTNITTTTATSASVTVPATAKQFMARVRASDNLGFTSSTYVSGSNLEVRAIQGFIGVNNIARRATKMYIGVNGVAREVTAAYIGDSNGKARKWF